MERRVTIFFVLLVLAFCSCGPDKSDSRPEPSETSTSDTKDIGHDEISELVKSLETWNLNERSQSVAQLEKIARESPENKGKVVAELVDEISDICGHGSIISSEVWFQKVGTMSTILADLHSTETLDLLIDCSNHRRPAGTQAMNEFATMEAIVQFKKDALPALEKKLAEPHDDIHIKCSISSILSSIGGNESERILRAASKIETNEEIQWCIRRSLNHFELVRKGLSR